MLGGRYHSDGSYAGFAAVSGRKENGTSGDPAGYLSLASRANGGAVTERWRIGSSGDLVPATTHNVGASNSKVGVVHANTLIAYTRLNVPVASGVPTLSNDGDVAIGVGYYGPALFFRRAGVTYAVYADAA
jgi:hypothetical protein